MIGSLLAARFIGKKSWGISAIFWAILLVIGLVVNAILGAPVWVSVILGLAIFLGVTFYYLHIHPVWTGIIMYVASFIINIIIGYILAGMGGGIWFAW